MTHTELRPILPHARAAADEMLARRMLDGSLSPDAAQGMRSLGFTTATRTLSGLRQMGMSEQAITDAFRTRLDKAEDDGDPQRAIAAEFTLAVWGGMQCDLAAWLGGTETR